MEAELDTSNRIGGLSNREMLELAILAPASIMSLLPGVKVPKLLALAAIGVVGLRITELIRKSE